MEKLPIYVIDTSSLINDTNLLQQAQFTNSTIIIPVIVLEELDKLKHSQGERARKARIIIKILDELTSNGTTNIKLDNDAYLTIDVNDYICLNKSGDSKILACAIAQKENCNDVTLVSDDVNLRLRAKAFNIKAISVHTKENTRSDFYTGFTTIQDSISGYLLQKDKIIDIENCDAENKLFLNQYVLFTDEEMNCGISMGRKISHDKIALIQHPKIEKIQSKNKEQAFSLDALMDPKLDLVSIVGNAGCGKTLMAIAAGWQQVIEKNLYDKMIIYKPVEPVGNDIGFIPGTIAEKMQPWFVPILDAFEFFLTSGKDKKEDKKGNKQFKNNVQGYEHGLEQYVSSKKICFEAMTYIRGRSINNAYIVIDECQNISKEEMKTIISRTGHNSKVVILGDLNQIDSKNLDFYNNGLHHVVDKMTGHDNYAHVMLTQGERSRLATMASKLL